MGALPTKEDGPTGLPSSPRNNRSEHINPSAFSPHPSQRSSHEDLDIPHEKRLAKRQIEVYYRDFFMLYHDREHAIARIESAARAGHIDEATRVRLRKEQFMRELEYIRRKRNPMSIAHYEIIRKIGQGSFGEVFLVRHRGDRRLYAMKKLQKRDMIYKRQVHHVWLERFVLASVGEHPLVVKMHYSFQDEHHLYFIMEYLHGGDMMTMFIRKEFLPEDWARFYIAELVVAIDALHRTGIIHRDIKPDNILFRKDGHICLSDFGLSKSLMQPSERHWLAITSTEYVNRPNFIEHIRRGDVDFPLAYRVKLWKALAKENAFSQVGTPNYIAPEVLQDRSYSESCDWWSVGVILFEMLVGCPPFCSRDPANVTSMICQWKRYFHFPRELPESRMSPAARDLICRLLCDSRNRLGAKRGLEEFKEHPFFAGIDWHSLARTPAPFIPELESEEDTRYFEDDITKSDISKLIPRKPEMAQEPCSGLLETFESGNEDTRNSTSKITRRRSSKRFRYNRNRDLEFVGFTFIPRHLDTQWGGYQNLNHEPHRHHAAVRRGQQSSTMTNALSLEGGREESRLKPLRSPRGAEAAAVIAAAEVVTEKNRGTHLPDRVTDAALECKQTETSDGRSGHVRFVDTNEAVEPQMSENVPPTVSSTADGAFAISTHIQMDREQTLSEPESFPAMALKNDEELENDSGGDSLGEKALGAEVVKEVSIRPSTVFWDELPPKQTEEKRDGSITRSLHSCISLPELRSKHARSDVEDTDAEDETQGIPESANIEAESACSAGTDDDGVERRMSRLHIPEEVSSCPPMKTPRTRQATGTNSPQSGVNLKPTASEVDLFVDYASRELNTASRELTNTPTSNVPAVIRHAKEDLSGTAAEIQESLGPRTSTSTASTDMSEFPDRANAHPVPNNSVVSSDSM
ncbi:Serine/threonine protein kinase Nuclear [Chondrus crispus]|uniref:non-specific serine/threonine protein kinase n=1 Tax=Chondrus crispus TaxID=2769 RepID=R7QRK1_CHOCR|nr:Serine/threonine protein kinase Nuclear [Chondrus crispus]CDF40779.1 Serine/threonine protein kinase Nuclear [Chondrus crispus]|eukprot:XP_005711073.1 Serine/threonine protein kinase Nuclear [Chondrus crispus]